MYKQLLLFLCISYSFLQAQERNDVGIGQWRAHYSSANVVALEQGPNSLYYATPSHIYVYIKDIFWFIYIDQVNGLSDAGIKELAYNQELDILVIAYENGNIDIYDPSTREVKNYPAIKNNNSILGAKAIEHIFCFGKNIYFSCNFGLVLFDYELEQFSQTTFVPNMAVLASARLGDTLYMATTTGIYQGVVSPTVNLRDFGLWEKQGRAEGLGLDDYESSSMQIYKGELYASINDTLMRRRAGTWQHIEHTDMSDEANPQIRPFCYTGTEITRMELSEGGERLLLATETNAYYEFLNDSLLRYFFLNIGAIGDIARDQSNFVWLGNPEGAWRERAGFAERLELQAPHRDLVSKMTVDRSGRLWCAGGPVDYRTSFFNNNGIYSYDNQNWKNYNRGNSPLFSYFYDVCAVAAHPARDEWYFGSFISGFMRMDADGEMQLFDGLCLGEEPKPADTTELNRTRVTAFAFDSENGLWMTNLNTTENLVYLDPNGRCQSFGGFLLNEIRELAIDRNGYKWMATVRNGMMVFDEGRLDDEDDDRVAYLSTGNSELGTNNVNTVVADRRGTIWAGTSDGLTIFSCGSNVFEGQCPGNRPVINPDNFNGRLLENENINSIAVDGANRKWIGTENGLFLFSEDGLELLEYFTSENSPLPDDNIRALAIDPKDGYLYIACDAGILSYRGEATRGRVFNDKSQVKVFPNPVRPDYTGPIAVQGLVENVQVKITDVAGRLVYEGRSLGGQVIWNGQDYNGRRVASGVYLVFTVNSEATERLATKIVLVN